jgi:hypothetical protein
MATTRLQRLIMAMDEEYLILEYLVISSRSRDKGTALIYPETLQAPHLLHLTLLGFALPIGSRLLTAAMGLVTLYLEMNHSSAHHPNTLLQWLSQVPQLEMLVIHFEFPVSNRDVEGQLTHTPIMTPLTFNFLGSEVLALT